MAIVKFIPEPSDNVHALDFYFSDPSTVDPINGFELTDAFYGVTARFDPITITMPYSGHEAFDAHHRALDLFLAGDATGGVQQITTAGYNVTFSRGGARIDQSMLCHPLAAQHGTMAGTLYPQNLVDAKVQSYKRYPVYYMMTETQSQRGIRWGLRCRNMS